MIRFNSIIEEPINPSKSKHPTGAMRRHLYFLAIPKGSRIHGNKFNSGSVLPGGSKEQLTLDEHVVSS